MAHSTRIGGYLRRPTAYPWRDPLQQSSPEPTHSSTVNDGEKLQLVLNAIETEPAGFKAMDEGLQQPTSLEKTRFTGPLKPFASNRIGPRRSAIMKRWRGSGPVEWGRSQTNTSQDLDFAHFRRDIPIFSGSTIAPWN